MRLQDETMQASTVRTTALGEIEMFYREAGDSAAPAVLLLHGFPTSSHMFCHLIPRLADTYRVIAPELPGFGFTKAPACGVYERKDVPDAEIPSLRDRAFRPGDRRPRDRALIRDFLARTAD